jgi:hypothetical protein
VCGSKDISAEGAESRTSGFCFEFLFLDVVAVLRAREADTEMRLLEGKKPLSPDLGGTHSTQAAIGS